MVSERVFEDLLIFEVSVLDLVIFCTYIEDYWCFGVSNQNSVQVTVHGNLCCSSTVHLVLFQSGLFFCSLDLICFKIKVFWFNYFSINPRLSQNRVPLLFNFFWSDYYSFNRSNTIFYLSPLLLFTVHSWVQSFFFRWSFLIAFEIRNHTVNISRNPLVNLSV